MATVAPVADCILPSFPHLLGAPMQASSKSGPWRKGLWMGIVCGLMAQVVMLSTMTLCTNWEQEDIQCHQHPLHLISCTPIYKRFCLLQLQKESKCAQLIYNCFMEATMMHPITLPLLDSIHLLMLGACFTLTSSGDF